MRPRIGITTSPSLHEGRFSEALDRAYATAVLRAGALPLVLPVLDPNQAVTVAACLDGLVLSGGGDVDPVLYGGDPISELRGVDPRRDAYELALVREALARGLPILGTCRGIQLLNVAMGGTLVTHLPDSDSRHCARDRWGETVHTVSVRKGSMLRGILGRDVVGVNSLHHQAVAEVGTGLRAVAWADDGVVEAVEALDGSPVLGVQWHPELLLTPPGNAPLFGWLVEAARQRRPVAPTPTEDQISDVLAAVAEIVAAANVPGPAGVPLDAADAAEAANAAPAGAGELAGAAA